VTRDQYSASPRFWAVLPAAGIGSRMGAAGPKQYLPLHGKSVLEHTLARIVDHPSIAATVVAIAAGDRQWSSVAANIASSSLMVTQGGAERCHSVLSGLRALEGQAAAVDWVLVHDAARPCLRREDVDRLIEQLQDHPVGGLLGIPVTDTMKRSDEHGNVIETVCRDGLWRALTPQMFRYGLLMRALIAALDHDVVVTDEAAAIEMAGHTPRMVEGHADNIKITHPQDLVLAEIYMQQQEEG